ncbi:MAG TPA: hypothetical protein VGK32_12400 [Vicinamibacterales bacterium]|jgi:hypothetical protein
MEPVFVPMQWMVAVAAAGGVLNAVVSHDVHLWPAMTTDIPGVRIARPGLLLCGAVGALPGALLALAVPLLPASGAWPVRLPILLGAVVSFGFIAARWLTNETDKRLLKAALCTACEAPAALPDAIHAIRAARPRVAYELACRLRPRTLPLDRFVEAVPCGPPRRDSATMPGTPS